MEFRDVTAILQGSSLEIRELSFSGGRVALLVKERGAAGGTAVEFQQVELMRWKTAKDGNADDPLDTVGLEKLGPGEVWRLYLQTVSGAELELSCRTIVCGGAEVTGIGRSYRH